MGVIYVRRIFLGIISILVLGGLVFGATQAWFSDTETSTGNILTAGSIDLKVDHAFASYNGDDCNACTVSGSNLVVNPSFEANGVTHSTGWDIFDNGTANMGWSVEWVNATSPFNTVVRPSVAKMEFHKSGNLTNTGDIPDGWLAQDGDQYTELDTDWNGHVGSLDGEPALAKIYQDIPTTAGKKYELRFWHSYRPGEALGENPMTVKWNGGNVATVQADGTGQTSTNWTEYTYEVIATGALTRLEFEGGGVDNSRGIFLDNVSLKEKTCTQDQDGGFCKLWETKDLAQGDIFWNFRDIKPGDYGRNVISLNVTSNDAWACLLPDNVVDNENVRIDPEVEANDTTDDPGELSQFINVFAWQDDNQDGIKGPGETTVYYGPGPLFDLEDGISVADSGNPPPLTSGDTKYVGLAWCVGTMALPGEAGMTCDGSSSLLNVAQTDIMTADLVAYAEQVRNNTDFKCQDVELN